MSEAAWIQLAETIENAVEGVALDEDEVSRAERDAAEEPELYGMMAPVRAIQRALAGLEIDDADVLRAYAPCMGGAVEGAGTAKLASAMEMHAAFSELARMLEERGFEGPGLAFAIRMYGHYVAELRAGIAS